MTTTSRAAEAITYQDLYRRWERGNWSATEIDFSEDRRQWHEEMSDLERRSALWFYSLFFHGEDAVADNLGPYIDAAPREEQKYFLTTQQVDEARHAVFFARFMGEVVGTGDDVATSLETTRPQLSWGFRKVFERLDRMADELRRDPSPERLAAGVTLYHIIIEATMAQPGQHFIEQALGRRNLLPGFLEGMRNVAQDEQRHIGFGVKLLSDLVAEHPGAATAAAGMVREIQPYDVAVLVPPDWDRSYLEVWGATLEDIYEDGARSFETKLRSAGLPLETFPGGSPHPLHLTHRERGIRGIKLLEAGVLGEPSGRRPSSDPEVMAELFDSTRARMEARPAPERPFVIQWEFSDAEPWWVRREPDGAHAGPGIAERPDVRLRCSWAQWCDIAAAREDPRRAILARRLRVRGRPAALLRLPQMLGE